MERRHEPRLAPGGTIRVHPGPGTAGHEGRLVDVSARGVRFRTDAPTGLAAGESVRVTIRIEPTASPTDRVLLAGRGTVVRRAAPDEVAVRLDAPLEILERFPAFRVL